jgi:hypothetical protein
MLIERTADNDQGQAHLSPGWSQPALSLHHKVSLRGVSGSQAHHYLDGTTCPFSPHIMIQLQVLYEPTRL